MSICSHYAVTDYERFDPYEALYIHVPFCAKRCHYCDFKTSATRSDDPRIVSYVEELVLQIRSLARLGLFSQIKTIYFGGGTPSFLGSKALTQILYALSLSIHFQQVEEITLECNPESVDERLVKDLYALGVNRISLGVQSFNDTFLQRIGRIHSSERIFEALDALSTRFDNISMDLMCGLPAQEIDDLQSDLETIIALKPRHISIYPLHIEDSTPLQRLIDQGLYPDVDEDLQADMMIAAHYSLTQAGYGHYEVSNFAQAGFESKHNTAYWRSRPYIALGPGGISMRQAGGIRERFSEESLQETIYGLELLAEDAALRMRLSTGISAEMAGELRASFSDFDTVMGRLQERGLVEKHLGSYRASLQGWLLGNEIFESLMFLDQK